LPPIPSKYTNVLDFIDEDGRYIS